MFLCLVQKISRLNSIQTKFRCLHYFPAAILRPHTRLYNISRNILTNISTLGELCLLYVSYKISQFLHFIHFVIFDFFYCVTVNTPYIDVSCFLFKGSGDGG